MRILLIILLFLTTKVYSVDENTKLLVHDKFELGMSLDQVLSHEKISKDYYSDWKKIYGFIGDTIIKVGEVEFSRDFQFTKFKEDYYLTKISLYSYGNLFKSKNIMSDNVESIRKAIQNTERKFLKESIHNTYQKNEWYNTKPPSIVPPDNEHCYKMDQLGTDEIWSLHFNNSEILMSIEYGRCEQRILDNKPKHWTLGSTITFLISNEELFKKELRGFTKLSTF